MSEVIIIRGPLGVGKTSIAKELADTVNSVYISVDDVLSTYGLDKVEDNIPVENFIKANAYITEQVAGAVKSGQGAVIDGNFYYPAQIEDLIQRLPVDTPVQIFTLKAPLNICIKRDHMRNKPYGEDATRAVYNLVSQFDYGEVIDADNKTMEQAVQEIYKRATNQYTS